MLVHVCRAEMRMPMEKRMSQHRPILVPAIFALLSLAASCAVSARAVHAEPCIAKPNAPAPEGEHWYYRTDRTIGRQCWYLGPEDNQRGATQASDRPASDVGATSGAPQPAHSPPAAAPPPATEANFPTPTDPPPAPEATKLPFMPPIFQLAPAPAELRQSGDTIDPPPASAEQRQSGDAIDSPPAPANDPASEPLSPAIAQSSADSAPLQSTNDADHTLALAMFSFLAIAISGSALEVMRWLRRRKSSNRRTPNWATSNT